MARRIVNMTLGLLWWLLLSLVVALALYVSLGRYFAPLLAQYRASIEHYLYAELQIPLRFESLSGAWASFSPIITLQDVRLQPPGFEQPALRIDSLYLELDVPASLRQWSPVLRSATVAGVELALQQEAEGHWRLLNWPAPVSVATLPQPTAAPAAIAALAPGLELLLAQQHLKITQGQVRLLDRHGHQHQLSELELELYNRYEHCRIQGRFKLDQQLEPQRLMLEVAGDPRQGLATLDVRGYAQFAPQPLAHWLEPLRERLPLEVTQLVAGAELWGHWAQGAWQDVRGQLQVPALQARSAQGHDWRLQELSTTLFWQRQQQSDGAQWQLLLDDLSFRLNDYQRQSGQLQLAQRQQGAERVLELATDEVLLAPLTELLLASDTLPERVAQTLRSLSPQGALRNLRVLYPQTGPRVGQFLLQANLDRVGVAPWQHAPGGHGISGWLEATPQGGRVRFASERFMLHFPRLFRQPWYYDQAWGEVSWQRHQDGVTISGDKLRLSGDVGEIRGRFQVTLPPGQPGEMLLALGMIDLDGRQTSAYLPAHVMNPDLVAWLDRAVQDGRVRNGGLLYHGSLAKGAGRNERSVQMYFDLRQAELDYLPPWPKVEGLDGVLQISGGEVEAVVTQARYAGVDITEAQVQVSGADSADGARLTISGRTQSSGQRAWSILRDTPLAGQLPPPLRDWQLRGQVATLLDLDIPLAKQQAPVAAEVTADFSDAHLFIPTGKLDLRDLQGRLHYSTRDGIRAERLTASFLGGPVTVEAQGVPRKGGMQLRILAHGEAELPALAEWSDRPELGLLRGRLGYQAVVQLGPEQEDRVEVTSDLVGVEAPLPQPYGKRAEERRALRYLQTLEATPRIEIDYGQQLRSVLFLDRHGVQRGSVMLGRQPLVEPRQSGLWVGGQLPMAVLEEWQQLQRRLQALQQGTMTALPGAGGGRPPAATLLRRLELRVGRLRVGERVLRDLNLELEPASEHWRLTLSNSQVAGEVQLPYADHRPWSVELSYLNLLEAQPSAMPAESTDAEPADPLAAVDFASVPDVNFKAGMVRFGDRSFGPISFNLRANEQELRAEQLQVKVTQLAVSGLLRWQRQGGREWTSFSGEVKGRDVGRVMSDWGYEATLESRRASLEDIRLSWPGSPLRPSLQTLEGELLLKIRDGRFLNVESGAPLRAIGLFNFDALARRLRLDFSDLHRKGLSYDTIEGRLQLRNGVVKIQDQLRIQGVSTKFAVSGQADLRTRQLNQYLVVTLPVSQTLPLAALIAGAPQVGGAIFVMQKLFGNLFDKFTSARYHVTGSWDDPQIELVSVFDNKARQADKKE